MQATFGRDSQTPATSLRPPLPEGVAWLPPWLLLSRRVWITRYRASIFHFGVATGQCRWRRSEEPCVAGAEVVDAGGIVAGIAVRQMSLLRNFDVRSMREAGTVLPANGVWVAVLSCVVSGSKIGTAHRPC